MNDRIFGLGVAAALLTAATACGGGSAADVVVDIDPGLDGRVTLVSARLDRPASGNAADVEVVLASTEATARDLELEGRWEDADGGFQGGATNVQTLVAGGRSTFATGTRSPRARTFRLAVRDATASADELLTRTLADATPKAEGAGITYTETPDPAVVPDWSPRGVLNGAPFTVKTMLFRPDGTGWRLELSDGAFDPLGGTARARALQPDLQTAHVVFEREPEAGAVLRGGPSHGGGHVDLLSPSGSGITAWNTAVTWVVAIDAWNREPWTAGGAPFQHGGTASGRLYVAYRGSDLGIDPSWISGTFLDAPIVYYGPPPDAGTFAGR